MAHPDISIDAVQKKLSAAQIEAFYSDDETANQVQHFLELTKGVDLDDRKKIVDVGGGCGHFARQITQRTGLPVRVLDTDPTSISICREAGVADAEIGDALAPPIRGDEGVVTFNLILHHLIGDTTRKTRELQIAALRTWRGAADYVYVNEYVYQAPLATDFAGLMIYLVTRSRTLSLLGSAISRLPFLKALRANTFGVGVRFRSNASWRNLFRDSGYEIVAFAPGPHEDMPLSRRLLLIWSKRRDSYLLRPSLG
jgi:hypothetical protein